MKSLFLFLSFLVLMIACDRHFSNNPEDQLKQDTISADQASLELKDSFESWSTEYVMGKFDPVIDTSFIVVNKVYADREGLYLRKDTYAAFEKMHAAANTEGVQLIIRSATRNFDYQKRIWEDKWNGNTPLESKSLASDIDDKTERARQILKYSSMPGSSRHHWGTDIDLNAFTNTYFEAGTGKKVYEWLIANAGKYGFCQPYTSKANGRTGYEEEKWHWSFLPVARQLTRSAELHLTDSMIQGFLGSEEAVTLGIVNNYVLGIDSACLLRSPLH